MPRLHCLVLAAAVTIAFSAGGCKREDKPKSPQPKTGTTDSMTPLAGTAGTNEAGTARARMGSERSLPPWPPASKKS